MSQQCKVVGNMLANLSDVFHEAGSIGVIYLIVVPCPEIFFARLMENKRRLQQTD